MDTVSVLVMFVGHVRLDVVIEGRRVTRSINALCYFGRLK